MHELTHLIDIPFGVIIMTLFLVFFLICFNVFLFYKWSCSIEEYKTLKEEFLELPQWEELPNYGNMSYKTYRK